MSIVGDIRDQLVARLEELQPAVDEYNEVKEALARLAGESEPAYAGAGALAAGAMSSGVRASRGRRASSAPKSTAKGQPALAGGARAEEALRLVTEQPGVTVAELASAMKVDSSYLYRVLPALQRAGKVEKVGKGYQLVAAAATTA